MVKRIFALPKLREATEHRHVSWNEIFFDLIFVAAISRLGRVPYLEKCDSEHPANGDLAEEMWIGYRDYLALFFPVWWTWFQNTLYFTLFDPEDLIHTILYFTYAFSSLGLSANVQYCAQCPTQTCNEFIYNYVAVRAANSFAWFYASVAEKRAKLYCALFGFCGLTVAVLWIGASIIRSGWGFIVCWWGGILLDIIAFGLSLDIERRTELTLNLEYLTERFDSYVFISLGEVVVGSQIDPTSPKHSFIAYVLSGLLLFLGFQFKIIYSETDPRFERGGCHAMERNRLSRFAFVILQYPLNAGIVSLAYLFEEMIHIKIQEKDERELEGYKWRLTGGVGIVVLMQTILQLLHQGAGKNLRLIPKEIRVALRLLFTIFVVTMPLTMKMLSPNEFVLLLAGTHLILVLVDLIGSLPRNRNKWGDLFKPHSSGACPSHRRHQHKPSHNDIHHNHNHNTDENYSSSLLSINSIEESKDDTPLLPPT